MPAFSFWFQPCCSVALKKVVRPGVACYKCTNIDLLTGIKLSSCPGVTPMPSGPEGGGQVGGRGVCEPPVQWLCVF